MRIRGLHSRRRRKGAAAVEAAILLSVLCYLCFIVTDYSRLFFTLATLSDCARAGAMYYATRPAATLSGIQQAALGDASDLSPAPTITATSMPDGLGNTLVSVTASYTFHTLMPQPGIASSVNLSRQVVMMLNPP